MNFYNFFYNFWCSAESEFFIPIHFYDKKMAWKYKCYCPNFGFWSLIHAKKLSKLNKLVLISEKCVVFLFPLSFSSQQSHFFFFWISPCQKNYVHMQIMFLYVMLKKVGYYFFCICLIFFFFCNTNKFTVDSNT